VERLIAWLHFAAVLAARENHAQDFAFRLPNGFVDDWSGAEEHEVKHP
jgi:hypothetical protein